MRLLMTRRSSHFILMCLKISVLVGLKITSPKNIINHREKLKVLHDILKSMKNRHRNKSIKYTFRIFHNKITKYIIWSQIISLMVQKAYPITNINKPDLKKVQTTTIAWLSSSNKIVIWIVAETNQKSRRTIKLTEHLPKIERTIRLSWDYSFLARR